MAEPSVFVEAAHLLDGLFTTDPANRESGNLTPYAAVKQVFGVHRDDHPIAYNGNEWELLAKQITSAFDVLEDVVSEDAGRKTRFIVWSTSTDRTLEEVKGALNEADRRAPQLVVTHPARLRPTTPGMPGARKPRWVICNLLGTVAESRGSEVSDVIRELLPANDPSNLEVIARLDTIIDNEGLQRDAARQTRVHVELSRAWGTTELRGSLFYKLVDTIGSRRFWKTSDDTKLNHELQRLLSESRPTAR